MGGDNFDLYIGESWYKLTLNGQGGSRKLWHNIMMGIDYEKKNDELSIQEWQYTSLGQMVMSWKFLSKETLWCGLELETHP